MNEKFLLFQRGEFSLFSFKRLYMMEVNGEVYDVQELCCVESSKFAFEIKAQRNLVNVLKVMHTVKAKILVHLNLKSDN